MNPNKSFGLVFFVIFFLIGVWPLLNSGDLNLWSIVISVIFLILALFYSKFLTPFNSAWIKLGKLLGQVISPIVMAIVFFTVLTPINLIIKLFGKDLLKIKFSKEKSYWIKREKDMGSMKRQF